MPSPTGFGFVAGGNIAPKRFVKQSTSEDNTLLQAGAGDKIIGISQQGTRNAPYSTLDDGYCAISGETFRAFFQGEVCPLELGGSVAAGDRLKSDSNGKGVTASGGDEYGARALESGVSGESIQVLIEVGKLPS